MLHVEPRICLLGDIGLKIGYPFKTIDTRHKLNPHTIKYWYYMYTQYFIYTRVYLLYLHMYMYSYSLRAKYLSAVSVNIGIATDTN